MPDPARKCLRCGRRRRMHTILHDDALNGGKGGELTVCLRCAKTLLPFKGVRYVSGAFPVMRSAHKEALR